MARKRLSKMAKRYQAVYDSLYEELPRWKREAIEGEDKRIFSEFAQEVIKTAETAEIEN